MRLALLAVVSSCTAVLAPERLAERIERAEYQAEAHLAACRGEAHPPEPVGPWVELHDEGLRCLATAAEDYARCVTCCGCLDDGGACLRAYEAGVGECE